MRLLYIADGRSAIALNWIEYFVRQGHEVHLASTFPCEPLDGLASRLVMPVGLSELYGKAASKGKVRGEALRGLIPVTVRTRIRQMVAPYSFSRAAQSLADLIENIQPQVVHAMRIPYEGMIASLAIERLAQRKGNPRMPPLMISVWGNDFTLHARSTRRMAAYTRKALKICDGLHTDCQRDHRLAKEWGFNASKPAIVLPGGGGVRMDVFFPAENGDEPEVNTLEAEPNQLTIINPRGFRVYVRNDTFFKAIPMVLERLSKVRFICPGMKDEPQAQRWVNTLGLSGKVELLPTQTRLQMAELFRQADISLSISEHDGTPNTLLEAMACGCFPIVGNIEALGEWVMDGENGCLVDPGDPYALAEAICKVIAHPEMRREAREKNLELVKERAEYERCMKEAEGFYEQLISNN